EDGSAKVVYTGPFEAPITQGDVLAELVIARQDLPEARIPLIADRSIARGGLVPRLRTAFVVLKDKLEGQTGLAVSE
ncbi:MAG: D-alanyl-D-alanine carboxypeptidase, partial [Alphaproteobacteria bacterium]|nr:D-alanyl-D-alanine carboxypeptidase [Alphaproteobacteria bacterium]MBU1572118.1 D-alanyl-D-alanine carboxypeptidase [Alphaproteobacteria bacterium]